MPVLMPTKLTCTRCGDTFTRTMGDVIGPTDLLCGSCLVKEGIDWVKALLGGKARKRPSPRKKTRPRAASRPKGRSRRK